MTESLDLFNVVRRCPHCKGVGKKLIHKKVVNCQCVEKALFDYRLSISNLPPRLSKFEFKDYLFKNSNTFKKAQKYVQDAPHAVEKGVGLCLYGAESDCNMLAIGVLKELMKQGYSCYFAQYASCMTSDLRGTLLDDRFTFVCLSNITTVLDNLTNFRSTVLTETNTNYAISYLEQLLSTRASLNLPTILTSSVGFLKLAEKFPHLGVLLYGHLLEVKCVENDFRNHGAYEKLNQEFGFDEIL
jgi:DNA replication protein DnaC